MIHVWRLSSRPRRSLRFLLACGGPGPGSDPASEEAPSYGGTAIVAIGTDFDVFNELATTSALVDQVIGHVLFQNLLVYDENLDYAPALADSFWVAEDGLSATFRIRDGVAWHDGVPVTADDIVWSFDMSMLDETAYPERQALQYVESAERDRRSHRAIPVQQRPRRAPRRLHVLDADAEAPARGRPSRRDDQRAVQSQPGRQRALPLRVVAGRTSRSSWKRTRTSGRDGPTSTGSCSA